MSSIDDQIEQAIREGKFDNLAGKGRPFRWDDNPHEDPEMSLAHHMLKSSGYTLPWIETRQQILADWGQARQALARTWDWRMQAIREGQPSRPVEMEWQRAVSAFKTQVAALNKRIASYNLDAPHHHFELPLCNAEQEIASLMRLG